jgi:4-amino-4-deoxy-L-arabinose transferase-like glycosyltransferase
MAAVGTGFLTKMMQAFLVVPAIGLVYLIAAPTPLRRRLLQLAAAAGALVVASGWWVAIVQLTPAADRPYIGGSQDNNLLNLIFGYNGLGRLSGSDGAPRDCSGSSEPSSAPRSRGSSRPPWSWAWRACGCGDATPAPTGPAPPCCCGADGSS